LVPEAISLEAVRERFGKRTPKRQFLFERFQMVFNLLHESGKVKHVYIFGSFSAAFPSPNDVDLFVVMAADFTTRGLSEEVLGVFTHDTCRMRYNVDVFWVTEAIGQEHIDAALDVFSRNRLQEPQAVLEVSR
jgi:predicted nucleotidyltransferase